MTNTHATPKTSDIHFGDENMQKKVCKEGHKETLYTIDSYSYLPSWNTLPKRPLFKTKIHSHCSTRYFRKINILISSLEPESMRSTITLRRIDNNFKAWLAYWYMTYGQFFRNYWFFRKKCPNIKYYCLWEIKIYFFQNTPILKTWKRTRIGL